MTAASEAADRVTAKLAAWYLYRLCELLDRLEAKGLLPTDPSTTWLARGARSFVREWVEPVSHRDILRVVTECEMQIALEYDAPEN